MTLVLFGPTGTGKTQLARSIFSFMGINYLEISDVNDFKNLDLTKHRGILLDEVDFSTLNRGLRLNILDASASKLIKVKYGFVRTEAFMPRIVTTNNLVDVHKNFKELKRRIQPIYIPEQISSKFSLNISIYNNHITQINKNYYRDLGLSNKHYHELKNKLIKLEKKVS